MNKPLISDMQEKYNSAEGTKVAIITAYDSYNKYAECIDKKIQEDKNRKNQTETIQMPTTEKIRNGVESLVNRGSLEGNVEER